MSLTYGFKSHLPHQAEPGRTSRLRFFFIFPQLARAQAISYSAAFSRPEPGRTSRLRFFFIPLIQTLHQPTKSHDIQDDIPILDNKLHFNKDFFSKNN